LNSRPALGRFNIKRDRERMLSVLDLFHQVIKR
jgi:hypothetical protein